MGDGVNNGPAARLDVVLAELAGISRSRAQTAIATGHVAVDGKPTSRVAAMVRTGAMVCYTIPERRELSAAPEQLPLDIVFEDEHLLVLNKPRGMVVHPSAGHASGTLVNAVLGHVGDLPGEQPFRPGVVHRIDKDTSGLLLMAKSEQALQRLSQMVRHHLVDRRYLAITRGVPREREGCIDAPIGRHPSKRTKQWVLPTGRAAVTEYTVRESVPPFSLLAVRLQTGRTHQIRVHLAYRGWPIAADPLYGPGQGTGQLLHAATLGLLHPVTCQPLVVTAPVPDDMRSFWKAHGGSDAALLPPMISESDLLEG